MVKDEIVKSQVEKERLSCLLKESQLETDKLRKRSRNSRECVGMFRTRVLVVPVLVVSVPFLVRG